MVKDPVCGMEFEKEKAAARQTYENNTYYFCSTSCHDKFKTAPQKYAEKSTGGHAHQGHGGCC